MFKKSLLRFFLIAAQNFETFDGFEAYASMQLLREHQDDVIDWNSNMYHTTIIPPQTLELN